MERSGAGMGRFTINSDDPQAALVQARRIVRWRVNGADRASSIIDDLPRDETGDPDPASVEVTGPGLAGWMGTGRGGAVVYPPRMRSAQTHRYFGWASNVYQPTTAAGWAHANATNNSLGRQNKPDSRLPRLKGEPDGWPDGRAEWLAYGPLIELGNKVYHNDGEMLLFRRLPPVGNLTARAFVVGSTEWEFFFDGERVASGGGFRNVVEVDLPFENREVVVGAHVKHERNPEFRYSPMLFAATILGINADTGEPSRQLFRTYTPGNQPGSPPQTWSRLANPDTLPGVTAGRVVRTLLDEAQARGALGGLAPSFTASTDSNGDPWTTDEINFAFPVGTKYSTVLDEVCELAGCEYRVRPDGTFDLANRLGVTRSGALAPAASRRASGGGVRATVALGKGNDGYTERTSSSGVSLYGRIEDAVTMGDTPRAALRGPMDRLLKRTARIHDEYDLVLLKSAPRPFVDFDVGDAYADGRVQSITMAQDDQAGDVTWAVTLSPEED